MFRFVPVLAVALALLFLAGACTTVDHGRRFNGVSTAEGRPLAYQATTTYAIHLFCGYIPFIGDASMEGSVDQYTQKAREIGGARVAISNVDAVNYCTGVLGFTIIPIFVTPMQTTIYGEVHR